jgi:hypothetical protein
MKANLNVVALAALSVLIAAAPSFAKDQFAKNHPRRAQVLGRDGNLNRRVNLNKGDLGGHYGQLKHEDQAIRHQEQRDARHNDGHITKGEQAQLNKEENHVNRQIKHDQQ